MRYPDCEFVAWSKPVPEKCPDCGNPYLIEKFLKAGSFLQCPAAGCKYKREMAPAEGARRIDVFLMVAVEAKRVIRNNL